MWVSFKHKFKLPEWIPIRPLRQNFILKFSRVRHLGPSMPPCLVRLFAAFRKINTRTSIFAIACINTNKRNAVERSNFDQLLSEALNIGSHSMQGIEVRQLCMRLLQSRDTNRKSLSATGSSYFKRFPLSFLRSISLHCPRAAASTLAKTRQELKALTLRTIQKRNKYE